MRKLVLLCSLVVVPVVFLWACNNSLPNGVGGGLPNGAEGGAVASFLPGSVSLDVSELPDEDASASAKIKDSAALGNGTPLQRTLGAAASIIHNFHRLADRALALGAAVRDDMTSADQTQVSGTLDVHGQQVAYKADFAAFDINGDGTAEGSGNAVAVPVAIRMWVDRGNGYDRFLCAVVTTKPSDENLGAGTLFTLPTAADPNAPSDLQIRVDWDRTDAAHRWNDAYVTGKLIETLALANGHQRVDVRKDTAGAVEKTIRSASHFAESPYGLDSFQSAVHVKPGSGAALLSGLATGVSGSIEFTDVCVDVIDQSLATNGECDAFDTQDMTLIDFPVGGETAFPNDFPETPTF